MPFQKKTSCLLYTVSHCLTHFFPPISLSLKQLLLALRPSVPVKAGQQGVPQSSSSVITSLTAYRSFLAPCWSGVRLVTFLCNPFCNTTLVAKCVAKIRQKTCLLLPCSHQKKKQQQQRFKNHNDSY